MATTSFDKDIVIKEPEAINKFMCIISEDKPKRVINKEKASDKELARGEELLKQFLSR